MKIKSLIFTIGVIVGLSLSWISCGKVSSVDTSRSSVPKDTIFLLPLDGIKDVTSLSKDFKDKYLSRFKSDAKPIDFEIVILPHMSSPDSCLNDYKTRMSAVKLIKWLNGKEHFVIGVPDRDVSLPFHGQSDWGVLGLSYLNYKYNAVIVSSFRVRNKQRDLWKVVAHEFTHGYYSLGHCPDDDPKCIMQDAKKHPKFAHKDSLCSTCFDLSTKPFNK